MAKYTVKFPDGKKFTGVYLSVLFAGGEGQTDCDYLAERFQAKGLTVTENAPEAPEAKDPASAEKQIADMTVAELKTYAKEHEIDLGDAAKKPDILAAIQAAEAEAAAEKKE